MVANEFEEEAAASLGRVGEGLEAGELVELAREPRVGIARRMLS